MKILAIVGSLRKDSYNRQLAEIVRKVIGDRAEFEILDYSDVPLINEDIEYPSPDPVTRVRDKVIEADALWIFTPEYNHFFATPLKNMIDWLSRPYKKVDGPILAHKPVTISGVTTGISGTGLAQDHLVALLSFLNLDLMNQPRLTIPNCEQQLDENGRLNLTVSKPFLDIQVEAYLDFLKNRGL